MSPSNFDDSMNLLTTQLENYGYGEKQPPCRIDLTRESDHIRISLVQIGSENPITLSTESIMFTEPTNQDEILEAFYYRFEAGDFSELNVINELEFIESLSKELADR